ncbi:Tctex1 domain-containing protein 2 [Coemansia biformis]|uniref:Tctex1 domain-containing protein 2 n=1 Tax=Coemansia biformis TaxID=1286918 RepID=A0A9W7YDY5_9FUNG|nr:Tctex1 domain-containing protein 2 [Coemansia biformis]
MVEAGAGHGFRAPAAKAAIGEVLRRELEGVQYEGDQMAKLGWTVGALINERLAADADAGLERYKFVTNVSIFQNIGQGTHMGCSAVWDPDTDAAVMETYTSDSIRCVAVVFAARVC